MTIASPAPFILDPVDVEPRMGSSYPAEFAAAVAGRAKRALGNALGLNNFGVNLVTLAPGAASSQRHWHSRQDEFVYVISGEITLVTDEGEQRLLPGMAAGFPAGRANGHHLVNRSEQDATYLEVGDRTAGDEVAYSDIDMKGAIRDGRYVYLHRDGEPY